MIKSAEVLLAGALLALMLFGEILLAHPATEYKRGYWYDEYLTYLVASDPSPAHSIQALQDGMDGMPIPYYFVLRGVHRLVGGDALPVYRACSTVAMWLALLGVYGMLRTIVDPLTSLVAVVAFWRNPLMARYALEARPYAMMLAGLAFLAWGLRLSGRRSIIMVFLGSAVACTMHYLGILPVSLMLLGELTFGPDSPAQRRRRIAPGVVGMGALIPLLPMLVAQHKGLGVTWVAPLSLRAVTDILTDLHIYRTLLFAAAAGCVIRRLVISKNPTDPQTWRRFAPLFAMAAVPLVLIIYSAVGESLLVDRYFIATLLGVPAVVGLALARSNSGLKVALIVALLVSSLSTVRGNSGRLRRLQNRYDKAAEVAAADGHYVVFGSSFDAFPLWFNYPKLQSRMAVVDLSLTDDRLPRSLAHMQHVERNTESLYELPPRWDAKTLARHGLFCVVEEFELTPFARHCMNIVRVDAEHDLYEVRE